MRNELISIAIPAYKSKYLKEAINSVLSQTYTNFELIIVNDKSPEDLDCIVLSYKDSRIRYYKNDINLGKKSIVHNWNKCLSYAKGEFFALLCDDDIMEPTFIKEMLELAYKYPSCNVFKSRCTIYDNTKKTFKQSLIWPSYEEIDTYLEEKMKGNRQHTISEFLYRTAYINKIFYIPFPAGFYSDDASIINFIQIGGIRTTSNCLITIRYSNEHISSNPIYNVQKAKAALLYFEWLKNTQYNRSQRNEILEKKIKPDLYTYFIKSTIINAIHILFIVPNNIWNLKFKKSLIIDFIKK